MVVYAAESPEHEVASMAIALRIRFFATAKLGILLQRCARLRLLPSWARAIRLNSASVVFRRLRKDAGLLCFSGMALLVSSCAQSQPLRSASGNIPYLALMRTNLSALPEAKLTGSLYVENGCVVFKLYGGTAGSTAVFDNRSRFVPLPDGFAIDRPQGRLLGGQVYTAGGGAADRQLPLVAPVPANCPQSLVLLGTAQPTRSRSK
jgi:hypothetical protein